MQFLVIDKNIWNIKQATLFDAFLILIVVNVWNLLRLGDSMKTDLKKRCCLIVNLICLVLNVSLLKCCKFFKSWKWVAKGECEGCGKPPPDSKLGQNEKTIETCKQLFQKIKDFENLNNFKFCSS